MLNKGVLLDLDNLSKLNEDHLGTKAKNLQKLRELGFHLPKTFILPTWIYEEHIKSNGLGKLIEEVKNSTVGKHEKKLKQLRQAILKIKLDEEIVEAVNRNICNKGIRYLAVRSSATSEDTSYYSFAGMYDTYLNVPCDQIPLYIKMVWASLWNERAYVYRRKMGVENASMAVILQEFIASDKSGVAFSADTVSLDPGLVVVSATYGLGEGVVSGEIDADTYYVDKFTGEVFNEVVNRKEKMVVPRVEGGIYTRDVDPKLSDKRVLNEEELKALTSSVFELERSLGYPIDVEWLIKDGRIYIVQFRPITTFEDVFGFYEIEWHDFDNLETIWTNTNIGELMPGIILPLTWSIMKENIDFGFREPFKYLPFLKKQINFTRLMAGRAYLNYDALRAIASILPGGSAEAMDELYLGGYPFEKESPPKARFPRSVEYAIRMLRDMSKKKREADRLIKKIDEAYSEFYDLNLGELSDEELTKLHINFNQIYEEKYAFAVHIGCSGYALPSVNMLKSQLLELGVDLEEVTLDRDLIIGLSEMESELAAAALWDLAKMVKENEELKNLFINESDAEVIKSIYARREDFSDFLDAFNKFLKKFGHRCVGEFKLENPRWSENREHIISMIKHFVETEAPSPYEKIEQQSRIREKAEERLFKLINKRIRNPLKRAYKKFFIVSALKNAQEFIRYRENMKTALVKLSYMRRKIILELAKRLRERGIIDEENDIFYLKNNELIDLLREEINREVVANIINRRKRVYRELENISPPDIIVGYLRLKREEVLEEVSGERGILRGIPGSPGRYTGKARVIIDPSQHEKLEKGDVLVAPATDLGWTPLYLLAGALVIEIGSVLSHGAIIAREYGIPAVLNVKNATRLIKDGDIVEVDGYKGIVRILKEEKNH